MGLWCDTPDGCYKEGDAKCSAAHGKDLHYSLRCVPCVCVLCKIYIHLHHETRRNITILHFPPGRLLCTKAGWKEATITHTFEERGRIMILDGSSLMIIEYLLLKSQRCVWFWCCVVLSLTASPAICGSINGGPPYKSFFLSLQGTRGCFWTWRANVGGRIDVLTRYSATKEYCWASV